MNVQYISDAQGRAIGDFIPIEEWNKLRKKHRELEDAAMDAPPLKDEILDSIVKGRRQARLHQKGKLKLKTAQQLLDELQ
ncbi:MAG: hypothetical protein V4649_13405 [Bacteroidota bacterium]